MAGPPPPPPHSRWFVMPNANIHIPHWFHRVKCGVVSLISLLFNSAFLLRNFVEYSFGRWLKQVTLQS